MQSQTKTPLDLIPKIEPGIYEISNHEYHNGPGLSKSGIDQILKSPRHYWARYLDPERPTVSAEKEDHFTFGTAAHKFILERDDFDNEYHILPASVDNAAKNTKDYKTQLALVPEGKSVLKHHEWVTLFKMRQAIIDHPIAGEYILDGVAERSIYWNDPETGVLCKCRPDYWIRGLAVPDYKTTADARPGEFGKSCGKYHYYIQAAFYTDGVQAISGESLPMPFIAQEKESPFAVGLYLIDQADIDLGRAQYKKAISIYARCLELNEWPAYPPDVKVISLPPWSKKL